MIIWKNESVNKDFKIHTATYYSHLSTWICSQNNTSTLPRRYPVYHPTSSSSRPSHRFFQGKGERVLRRLKKWTHVRLSSKHSSKPAIYLRNGLLTLRTASHQLYLRHQLHIPAQASRDTGPRCLNALFQQHFLQYVCSQPHIQYILQVIDPLENALPWNRLQTNLIDNFITSQLLPKTLVE